MAMIPTRRRCIQNEAIYPNTSQLYQEETKQSTLRLTNLLVTIVKKVQYFIVFETPESISQSPL